MSRAIDADQARRERGRAIAEFCRITGKDGRWTVPSQTGNGSYQVILNPPPFVKGCTCEDYEARGKPCKHVYAVEYLVERLAEAPNWTPTPPPDDAPPITKQTCAKRPTYKQNWPAYDTAQIQEKARLQTLLADLCAGIREPPPSEKGGRPRVPLSDRAFAAALKIYTTISGRRASTDIREANAKGHLSRAPHFTSVSRFLEDPALTPILHRLIAESARPLASVEVDFAVDSSGFTTNRFVRWFDHKYGRPKKQYDWLKASVMAGVKTNVVAAVEIDERYGGDSPKFIPLLNATVARGFTIREVSADTAYSSYENLEAVEAVGGIPYIAFKANANPSQPGAYDRMFHFYCYHRDEFLDHYHKRSNVETTFSMVKAKFGDHLRSKTDTAMVNEALCKILCHNVCVLIQSHYELGVEAAFWEAAEASRAVDSGALPVDDLGAWEWV